MSVDGNRCLCEEVGAVGLPRLNSAAETGELLTLAGPVDIILAVVDSRLSHAALPLLTTPAIEHRKCISDQLNK